MTPARGLVWVSRDAGLLAHWSAAFAPERATVFQRVQDLPDSSPAFQGVVWVDIDPRDPPSLQTPHWQALLFRPGVRVVAASSSPNDQAALDALAAGCAAYCHAFSDAATLRQVQQVVDLGQIWVGKSVMQRLVAGSRNMPKPAEEPAQAWDAGLTEREREVAVLAANGASNLAIARDCGISERTVKAHLSAVFTKLNLTDRLQLALRVHGIS
jgi:DNA-binding NarL/FixJ family response regulator